MKQHVLPANVGNDCELRMKRGDVGEVLVGSYAQVDAAWFNFLLQLRDDVLKRSLVGDKVV